MPTAKKSKPRNLEAEIMKAIRAVKAAKSLSIAKVRKNSGMSEAQFAKLVDAPLPMLREWEQGKSKPGPHAKKLIQIIDVVSKVIDKVSA